MYESLNYAKRKYSNEATDEWNSVVEGVAEAELTHPEMAWFFPHGLRSEQTYPDVTLHVSNQN